MLRNAEQLRCYLTRSALQPNSPATSADQYKNAQKLTKQLLVGPSTRPSPTAWRHHLLSYFWRVGSLGFILLRQNGFNIDNTLDCHQ